MKKLTFISLLIVFTSCQKEAYEDVSEYAGDYSLEYIEVSQLEFMLPEQVEGDIGIRVQKNGTIKTYVDNKFHSKYKMKELIEKKGNERTFNYGQLFQDGITVKFYDGDRIEISTFPYKGEKNVFHKH